ncbi:MAG: serine hydroxymethyltransferase [Candidatus Aenigmarchaeota archaeon]|nr:serine hydroxymethyltransferase [Candidatus Aenigmarchaeota archaeon]
MDWFYELPNLTKSDPEIAALIKKEVERWEFGLQLIPSENYASPALLEALGSVLTNKYAEGYPRKRYYSGFEFVDPIETIAIERAKKAFGVPHANVQPYSGSPANMAIYLATCNPGDVIMGLNLPDGGHLTHGWKTSVSGMFYKSVPYHVNENGYIDMEEVRSLAQQHRPRLIWVGATAYTREFDFEAFGKIADDVGAYLVADMSHVTGLILAGVHKSPVDHVHLIMTTTHKTLRGPRGAMILVTKKGLDKDPELADKIDRAVFPGLQGGPHEHQIAATAVALGEALKPEFREHGAQIVKNAKALASSLTDNGLKLVSGGTDNHLILIDLTPFGAGKGIFASEALEAAGIFVNKNTIPNDPSTPFYPSGIRLGTPALTTRGMKEGEMAQIGEWIAAVINETRVYELPEKEQRAEYLKKFRAEIKANSAIGRVKDNVKALCSMFPFYTGRA